MLRVAFWAALAYILLLALAWRFQERLAFPSPKGPLPANPRGEIHHLTLNDGTRLAAIYGDTASLSLKPSEWGGCVAEVRLPLNVPAPV